MRFSIVTVSFNAGGVIGRAMRSLQTQTFGDYEWLVVDGGSNDDTLAVVQGFTGHGLRSVSEPDQGIYDAMNKGAAMARGEYLFFLNADDQLADPAVLADVDREITRAPHDLVIGRILHETVQRKVLRDFSHLDRAVLMMDTLCHQAVFARRDWFQKVGAFDLRYRMAADYDWFLRSFEAGCSRSFTPRLVTVFNGEGAHAKAQARTRAEIEAVRRQHAGALGAQAFAVWRHLRHYRRRLAGQAPLGFLPA